mgnify:FL=1
MNGFLRFSALIFLVNIWVVSNAQSYILNEDFSSASGTTPPTAWSNNTITGTASDLWRFDNPGNRTIGFPIIGTFAIFDSENYSSNSGAESAELVSKTLDCSGTNDVLLYFDHYFAGSNGPSGTLQIFDGTNWNIAATYTDSTNGVESKLVNISQWAANVSNAKIKFVWSGNQNNFWAVDNIQVYAPLALDASISAIDNPVMPFSAGNQNIEASLSNNGGTVLTSATIKWSLDGVLQSSFSWSGNLAVGGTESNIVIGNYNFSPGIIQTLRIWARNLLIINE